MALNIISNFAANVAHRNLVMSDATATSSLSKLSAGQRVLSAKDDAASLAIGSRLRAEVAAMNQANQNTSQAASMLQIADGALGTVGDILVRMKALAVQASSGQFSSTERTVLNSEYQALSSEITRISQDTEFNGTQLIAGGASVTTQTVGDDGQLTALGVTVSYDTTVVTDLDSYRLGYVQTSSTDQKLTLVNVTSGDTQTIDIAAALDAVLAARADQSGVTAGISNLVSGETLSVKFTSLGVNLSLDENFARGNGGTAETQLDLGATVTDTNTIAFTFTTATTAASYSGTGGTAGINDTNLQALRNVAAYSATTGILTLNISGTTTTAQIDAHAGLLFKVDGGAITAAATGLDGGNHTVEVRIGGTVLTTLSVDLSSTATSSGTIAVNVGTGLFSQDLDNGGNSTSFTFKVGTGSASYDDLTFSVSAATATALGLASTNITTQALADTASAAVSTAINTVNQQRSDIGAAQNRLSFASNNLASAIENAESARSSLLDLDIAQEMSVFTSKQILVQTGISMLAQANQIPQNLLRLFQ